MKSTSACSFIEPRRPCYSSGRRTPPNFFADADGYLERGYYLAGYIAYEAGYSLVGLGDPPPLHYPLAQLGVYREPLRFDHLTGATSGPVPSSTCTEAVAGQGASAEPGFGLTATEHARQVRRVLDYLAAGDCYQINLTDAFEVAFPDGLLKPYLRLRRVQPTSYGAYLRFGDLQVASFSPELHFSVRGGTLTTRPMKGTAPRGRTLTEDLERRAELARDDKNRAENVMIVDLMRNDMGRLCRYGSIEVPRLFDVEPYGNVLQMTSTIRGELPDRPRLADLFGKLFPSGSVTGAPKRRAMEIIRELEGRARGIYTGAIGYAEPNGDMTFSVAIRTLVSTGESATLGAGSGIVIDSDPDEEYAECLLKAQFLNEYGEPFELIETMRLESGVLRLAAEHLTRLERSACYFGYPFDSLEAEAKLAELAAGFRSGTRRVRLSLSHEGRLDLTSRPLPEAAGELFVAVANERVDSQDRFLYHKTSRRARHERAMSMAGKLGLADLLFVNERGELTEGAVSNLFVAQDGELLTPPVDSGLLPGVGRADVLTNNPEARERVLYPEDLTRSDAIYLCSSLRGMRRVRLDPTVLRGNGCDL